MKPASIKKVLILVTILAVPGFLYYLLQDQGKNRYKPLPFFGPKEYGHSFHEERGKTVADTIYHQVKGLDFINQMGASVNWDNYKDKIVVFSVFYTQPPSEAVSLSNKAMRAFDAMYSKNTMIHFVSMSIDPVYDRPEVLAKYADSLSAKPGKWDLLTGDSTKLFSFINDQLFMDAHQAFGRGRKNFLLSDYFVLVDPQRRIRGYYRPTSQEDLSKLDDEIKVLIAEVLRNTEDGR
jgi:protein SCO1/2